MLLAQNSPSFRFTLDSDLLGQRVLKTDPVGWDQLGVHIARNEKLHGITLEYTVQLGFVKEGKAYLERAYAAAGIEADVRLLVEEFDPNAFAYEVYYAGRINFTNAEETPLEYRVGVENQNFAQKFLNRDTVKVDLFSGVSVGGSAGPAPSPLSQLLHSRAVVKRYEARLKGTDPFQLPSAYVFSDESRSQTLYFGFNDPKAVNELGLQQVNGGFVSGNPREAVPIYVAEGYEEIEFETVLNTNIQVLLDPESELTDFDKVDISYHFRVNGSYDTATVLASYADGSVGGSFNKDIKTGKRAFSVSLNPGDKLYLYGEVYTHDITGNLIGDYRFEVRGLIYPGSYLRMTAITRTDPTTCAGLLAYESLDRVAQALTDEPRAFRSDFFGRPDTRVPTTADGPGALLFVTGGFQLRGFPLLSAPAPAEGEPDPRKSLFANWRELFDSLQAIYALGVGIERAGSQDVIRVEDFSYFYPADVVLDLTGAGPLEVKKNVLAERHYASATVGYEQWRPEQINGLGEANSKREWTTPLTVVKNNYPALSRYTTAGLRMELVRRQRYVATATTDDQTDNDNFLICLLRQPGSSGGYEVERNQAFTRVENLFSPETAYNLRLTPARNLRRHGSILRAGLEPTRVTATIRFSFGEGNNGLRTQLSGEAAVLGEGDDIPVQELAPPIWRPLSYTFSAPMRRAQLRALLARPTGRVRFLDAKGQVVEGWILDFKHSGKEQTGEFTLLRCADHPS
jgi:hypothetical protein